VFVRAAGKLLSVIIDALYPVRIGQSCYLRFKPAYVHLFDASTGQALAESV